MSMTVNAYNSIETVNNSQNLSKKENTTSRSTQYKDVDEYARALQKKYNYFNANGSAGGVPTTVNIPLSLLQDCIKDPEKAANLEKSLKQIPDLVNYSKSIAGSCGCKITNKVYMVDADGNLSGVITTCTTSSGDSSASGNIEKKSKRRKTCKEKSGREKTGRASHRAKSREKSGKRSNKRGNQRSRTVTGIYIFCKERCKFQRKANRNNGKSS